MTEQLCDTTRNAWFPAENTSVVTFLLIIILAPVKISAPWISFVLNAIFIERKDTPGILLYHVLDVLKVGVKKWCPYAMSSVAEHDADGRATQICAEISVLYVEAGNGAAISTVVLDSSVRDMRVLES